MISFELVFGVKMKFKYWALILMPILTILPATGRDTMRGITTPLLTFPFGNDNQGGVSAPPGEYAGQPVVAGAINPYTGNATRVVNELSVPSVGEVGLNWTRYHNTRPNSGTAWFGSGGNWRHSYQWDFSYYLPVGESKTYNPSTGQYVISGGGLSTNGRIVLVYPNGTTNTFYETGPFTGIYTCSSSQVTDYIILDGASNVTDLATGNYNYTGFKLINSNNQVYHFSINVTSTISSQPSSFLLSSITDSKGQATTLSYNVSNNGIPMLNPYLTVTEPGGRYLQVNCTQLVSSSGGFGGGTTYTYPITSVVSSDSRTITFNYTTTTTAGNNGSTLYLYALTSVNYPESVNGSPSTSAAYTYGTFSWPAQLNPSLLTAKDTHAVGIPQTQYNYWPINLAPPVGSVESITEMASNSIVSTVGVVSADNSSLSPVALFPDQSGYVYNIQSTSGGLLQQTVNYTNNTNNVSYSSVSGALTTDPNFNFGTSTGTFTTTTQNSNTNSLATTRSVLGHILSRTWPIVPPETVAPSESWSYNNAGYLLSYTDTRTKTTTITRDPTTNLITSLAYPDNTTESFTYGAFNEVATHTRRNGGTEIYTYYTTENSGVYKGLLKSVQDAAGGVTSYAYDAHYRVSSVTNANLHTTSFSYDAAGRILTVTNPATTANPTPTTRSYTYDNYGNILTFQNEDLKTWRYTYDGFNRLLTTLDPVGRGFTYTYDPNAPANASPIQVTNTLTGKITFYTYLVNWGYKVYTATTGYGTPYAATTTYAYDPDGNVSQVTDPRTNNTKLYYDQRDRVSSAVDPASNTSTFSYDDASNLTDQVTPDGRTHNDYDAMNRLLDSTDPKLQEVKMTYDPEGALQTYQESNGATYSYTYDADERQLTMKYPDASAESYTYYALGNMHTYKTRDGRVQTVTYDERERQLNSSWNDGVTPAVSYTYDNASYQKAVQNERFHPVTCLGSFSDFDDDTPRFVPIKELK